MEKKGKAIALCRVSSDEQLKNNSLNRQNESVGKIADKYNLEIIRIWSGSVSSKRGSNIKRKDLNEMLDYCKHHKDVKALIVDEPDRFMRSIDEAFYFEVEFKKLGVKLLYSDDELNNDSLTVKMQRFMGYFKAEGSNEERIRKTISGHQKAIREGRYPFAIKLGYKKGSTPGVAEIDEKVGPLLKFQLVRIAMGLVSPTVALQDYNHSIEMAGIKKAPLKMDKWRNICTDPYYCGTVEMGKAINESNPNGLHKKLITKEQHEKIVEVFNGKFKNQKGPNPAGNPLYPFNRMITHVDCPRTKSKYNTFVGVTIKNGRGKRYEKYRCRGCYMLFTREEMRENISNIIDSIDMTESGSCALADALENVFYSEKGDIEDKKIAINSQKKNAKKQAKKLFDAYVDEPDGPIKRHLKEEYESTDRHIKMLDKEFDELGEFEAIENLLFCQFAIDFVDNLTQNILDLSPMNMLLCKQLLFPKGFCVDKDRNVYTQEISPIYRLRPTKKDSSESQNSLMVRAKRL